MRTRTLSQTARQTNAHSTYYFPSRGSMAACSLGRRRRRRGTTIEYSHIYESPPRVMPLPAAPPLPPSFLPLSLKRRRLGRRPTATAFFPPSFLPLLPYSSRGLYAFRFVCRAHTQSHTRSMPRSKWDFAKSSTFSERQECIFFQFCIEEGKVTSCTRQPTRLCCRKVKWPRATLSLPPSLDSSLTLSSLSPSLWQSGWAGFLGGVSNGRGGRRRGCARAAARRPQSQSPAIDRSTRSPPPSPTHSLLPHDPSAKCDEETASKHPGRSLRLGSKWHIFMEPI